MVNHLVSWPAAIRFLFLIAALVPSKLAADWPHLRGSSYDSVSTEKGIVDQWPANGPPILWTRDLGPGYSGVVVAGNRAFTLFQNKSGIHLIALDPDNGSEMWSKRVDWQWGGLYPGPYATPTVYGEHVYYATPTGLVGCVRASDGNSVWEINVRTKFNGRGTDFGFASSPLVEDGRVFLPVGGPGAAMVALNASDGATLWASGDDAACYCPAFPITIDGRRLIVGLLQNALVLFDPATGARVWREKVSDRYEPYSAWPLFDGRHLLFAAPFRSGARVFRLQFDGERITGKLAWSGKQFSSDVCSSVVVDGAVYGFDLHQNQSGTDRPSRGIFKCLDITTGKVRWETDQVGQASVLAVDGKLILWTETGTLVLARINADRYEELARAKILGDDGMCWAAPALSGKRLYLRDQKRVVCVYLGNPSELDPARLKGPIVAGKDGFKWERLIPKEPEFPLDEPTNEDLALWFASCAGIFVAAATVAGLLRLFVIRQRTILLFGIVAFLLGAAGTTAIGAWADTFALTWPVSLYVAFRGVLSLGFNPSPGWRHQVLSRVGLLLFGLLCYGYYLLCLAIGYAMAWGFLAGFVPSAAFAVCAARTKRVWLRWLMDALGFAIYFWTSGLFPGWKAAREK